jgi:hypothetical protein
MADLKILIYKPGEAEPDSKVIVPLKGVERVTPGPPPRPGLEPHGTLLEIEGGAERVVILLE